MSIRTHLDHLPDAGEVINELWGLPVPIRGADTVFRGGLRFTSEHGLVMALHGGPGSGKTTLALALGRHLAPFGIQTLFLTAEEQQADLRVRADGLVADELRRLSFLPEKSEEWLTIERYEFQEGVDLLSSLYSSIEKLSKDLNSSPSQSLAIGAPKPCKAVIVLDGLHDLILLGSGSVAENPTSGLREFIDHCRKLRALVILTTAEDWIADTALDYLVDMAVRLSQDATDDYGKKPDRRLMISKSRYQLCAIGTHGFQIAGTRGVRFSPQINYQLDRKAIWKTRLPSESAFKEAMRQVMPFEAGLEFASGTTKKTTLRFVRQEATVDLPLGSNIFINGKGSGGKAALALKIAMSPALDKNRLPLPIRREKILIVSFLYPEEYYDNIVDRLVELRKAEYPSGGTDRRPFCKTLHLYPGSLRPNDLFNRIEWELDAAELHGEPFNTVIIDGLHNVFLQFPEIEEYKLFWPQIYAALRCRPVTIITTHTTFVLQDDPDEEEYRLDDDRSEPLRHALVQKTDFHFEVSAFARSRLYRQWFATNPKHALQDSNFANVFVIRTLSAIGQPVPKNALLWSRERLVLIEPPPIG